MLVQLQLIFRKSIASTNKAGKNWVCGSWMYLPKTASQIFHSVSGNVKIKHLKPAFLCLSVMSCEVTCTARECRLQTFLIKAFATSSPTKWHLYRFPGHFPYPCLLVLVIITNTIISYRRFVSHKLQDDRNMSRHTFSN